MRGVTLCGVSAAVGGGSATLCLHFHFLCFLPQSLLAQTSGVPLQLHLIGNLRPDVRSQKHTRVVWLQKKCFVFSATNFAAETPAVEQKKLICRKCRWTSNNNNKSNVGCQSSAKCLAHANTVSKVYLRNSHRAQSTVQDNVNLFQ